MGLDMYLYLRKEDYNSKYSGGCEYPDELKQLEEDIEKRNFPSISTKVDYQVGYWRKFNALHGWIVDHLGGGIDECQEIRLDDADVEEIINMCSEILEDHSRAEDLLPCCEGFFFGGQEYDEWYFDNLKYTLDLMKKLQSYVSEGYEVIYQASW